MGRGDIRIKLCVNNDEIRRLISEKTYSAFKDDNEYKLAVEIQKLQQIMLCKLVNPDMELEINTKCTIEEAENGNIC